MEELKLAFSCIIMRSEEAAGDAGSIYTMIYYIYSILFI